MGKTAAWLFKATDDDLGGSPGPRRATAMALELFANIRKVDGSEILVDEADVDDNGFWPRKANDPAPR